MVELGGLGVGGEVGLSGLAGGGGEDGVTGGRWGLVLRHDEAVVSV